jgi:hypothetical protein
MKIFYLIIFTGFSLFAGAQTSKPTDAPPSQSSVLEKVVKFYPNPAVSIINFEVPKQINKDATLQIFNFIGKKVFEINNLTQKNVIPLNEFYRGVYIFQLRDKTGKIIESGKFQIAK